MPFQPIAKRTHLLLFFMIPVLAGAQVKVLFDASQAQTAANADWVPDADTYNLGVNATTKLMQTGLGNEANAQRYPTPAQSGITANTAQSYWKGALSHWALDLVRQGYTIETLPFNGLITYGVSTNPQDLANYKVFIVCEPNIRFSSSEKAAMLAYIQNGGGLFMIANHNGSDRNNDGWDPENIWNDLMTGNPFGITFDALNFSQSSTNIRNAPSSPILNGAMGAVTGMVYSSGTSMTLSPASNPTVLGHVFRTGASNTGTTQVLMAACNYGSGKVCAIGDSSPPDDGTGDSNDALYSSYATSLSGSHRKLLVNATRWLVTPGTAPMGPNGDPPVTLKNASSMGFDLWPNPTANELHVRMASEQDQSVAISIIDLTGRTVLHRTVRPTGVTVESFDVSVLTEGVYVVRASNGRDEYTQRFIRE